MIIFNFAIIIIKLFQLITHFYAPSQVLISNKRYDIKNHKMGRDIGEFEIMFGKHNFYQRKYHFERGLFWHLSRPFFFSEQVIEKDDVAARHLNYCLVTIYQELLGFIGRLNAILANELAS